MSKAFATGNRNQLFETLEEILLPDEMHLLHILTNDVNLKVRAGADYGPELTTSIGIIRLRGRVVKGVGHLDHV